MISFVAYTDGKRSVIGSAEREGDEVTLYIEGSCIGKAVIDEPTRAYLEADPDEINAYDIAPFYNRVCA